MTQIVDAWIEVGERVLPVEVVSLSIDPKPTKKNEQRDGSGYTTQLGCFEYEPKIHTSSNDLINVLMSFVTYFLDIE